MMVPLVNGGLGITPIRNSTHAVRRKLLDRLPPPPPGSLLFYTHSPLHLNPCKLASYASSSTAAASTQ